jgi:hypothetical protein
VAEIVAREDFDVKELAAYTTDPDTQVVEQSFLKVARAVTSLWEKIRDELRNELREEGFDTSGNEDDDDYVHLDDDNLDADDHTDIPTDEQAVEAAAKQRVLMASFETQSRDESARRLMVVERRVLAVQ